jgi:predicted alpha/beta-hydrolase family hydrolase
VIIDFSCIHPYYNQLLAGGNSLGTRVVLRVVGATRADTNALFVMGMAITSTLARMVTQVI